MAIALYPASAELLEAVVCFLELQQIKGEPRNTQNPVTGLLVSSHPAQSESRYDVRFVSLCLEKQTLSRR